MSAEKIRHLEEHLPYELLMLRHTHKELTERHHKLNFNCYLECFGIHARLLYAFLINKRDNGNNNFIASDFADYKPIPHSELSGAMQRVNSQIFHLAKARPSQPEEKFNTADADKLRKWIENAILLFLGALSTECRLHWNKGCADPEKFTPQSVGLKLSNTSSSETSGLIVIASSRPPKI